MNLGKTLKADKIRHVALTKPLCLTRETPLSQVIEQMQKRKTGSALILDGEKLVGIFTERDALTRVVGKGLDPSTPIEKLMTPDPKSLKTDDSVAVAIRLMNKGGYRRVPLVDEAGRMVGILSVRNIVKYLAEHFPFEVYNLPPNPHQVNRTPEGA